MVDGWGTAVVVGGDSKSPGKKKVENKRTKMEIKGDLLSQSK